MKKTILILCVIITCLSSMSGWALTVEEAFKSAPEAQFPLLSKSTRLDMLDYYNSGLSTASKNKLSGESRIISVDKNNMVFEVSKSSKYEIIILDGNDGEEIIAVIETLATPALDSKITFYTIDWKEAVKKIFEEPLLKDWLTDLGKKNRSVVETSLPFMLVNYNYNSEIDELVLTNNTKELFTEEEYAPIAPYLKAELRYKWNGKRMNKK